MSNVAEEIIASEQLKLKDVSLHTDPTAALQRKLLRVSN